MATWFMQCVMVMGVARRDVCLSDMPVMSDASDAAVVFVFIAPLAYGLWAACIGDNYRIG